MPIPLETGRLVIRPYRDADSVPLHDVFGSPEVMKWTPSAPSKDLAETAQRLGRTMAFTARQPPGLGLWAFLWRPYHYEVVEPRVLYRSGQLTRPSGLPEEVQLQRSKKLRSRHRVSSFTRVPRACVGPAQ